MNKPSLGRIVLVNVKHHIVPGIVTHVVNDQTVNVYVFETGVSEDVKCGLLPGAVYKEHLDELSTLGGTFWSWPPRVENMPHEEPKTPETHKK